jgi:predicted AlkP superfamily pyrophosphatase or phosphodiesterase
VAAFSLKARAAVTLGGQRPDAIAWIADEGAWVTSTAYPQGQTADVARFISAHPVEHELWTTWERALPKERYEFEARALGARGDDPGPFPHAIRTWDDWQASPLSDAYLGRMALDVARQMRLGDAGRTDFLAVSFSALDLVGHAYGPNSHEVQDVLIRLDDTLGTLLDGLDALAGRDNYVVALTADHGVAPTPERSQAFGLDAGRIPARAVPDAVQEAVTAILGKERWTSRLLNSDLYLDDGVYDRIREAPGGLARIREALVGVPGIDAAYTRDAVAHGAGSDDPLLRRLAASYMPSRSGDFAIVLKPYWLVGTGNGTSHGTPHRYDARVPIVLAGRGIRPGQYLRAVTPLDIAPTLAYLAGITLPRAQGHLLSDALETPTHRGSEPSTR